MAGTYGVTQAQTLLRKGQFEEAVAEATRAMERDGDDPEPLWDRAQALSCLGRHAEAAADLERAFVLDERAPALDTDALDDAYFSALLGAARADAERSVEAGVLRLSRYREVRPSGSHLKDASDWQKRLRGELRSEFVKERRD